MYTEKDFEIAKKTMMQRIWMTAGVLAVFLALMAVGLVVRSALLAELSLIVGVCVTYTLLVSKCLPWVRYNRYLRDMREGRNRETVCYYVDIADRVRVVDGVQIHDMNAAVDEELEDLRLFYWDADKPVKHFEKGQKVKIKSYGNFILEIEAV